MKYLRVEYLLPGILAAAFGWLLYDTVLDAAGMRELARVGMEARP
jgi:hypothetical protein